MTRVVPQICLDFLTRVEAMRLSAYQDSGGVWTIGVGHTGAGIVGGLRISYAQAMAYLAQDAAFAARRLGTVLTDNAINSLNDHQWSALVSFAFNLGVQPGWTIWKLINAGKLDQVPGQLVRFDKVRVNGVLKAVPGLDHRRAAEVVLWNAADAPSASFDVAKQASVLTPPSSQTRAADTPPTPDPSAKPLSHSKQIWAGATTSVLGVAEFAKEALTQTQSLTNAQEDHSELLKTVGGDIAIGIVVVGVVVMVIRWLDERVKHQ